MKKGKCSSLADFYGSGPSQEKTKRVCLKFKALVMKSVPNGGCTLICQYHMDVVGTNSLRRAYVGLKTSIGHF